MIIYSFTGYSSMGSDNVNIDYDHDTDTVSARTESGGIPLVTYDSYSPNPGSYQEIFRGDFSGEIIRISWVPEYPFAYSELIFITPNPSAVVIDSIVTTPVNYITGVYGSVTINVSGGTAPYQYKTSANVYQSSNFFDNFSEGTYIGFVQDSSGTDPLLFEFTIGSVQEEIVITPAVKDVIALSGAQIERQDGYKRVDVISEFGKVPSILYNGNFEQWDGRNFNFWTRYGGLNFSRVQRTVTNAAGAQISIPNYAMQFNERANSGKYLESAPIPVQKGDNIKLQYFVSKMLDIQDYSYEENIGGFIGVTILHKISVYYAFKIRIACVEYVNGVASTTRYLYNTNYGSDYTWVNSLATVNHRVANKDGNINNYSVSFSAPECPITGSIFIQMYGFEKVVQDSYEAIRGATGVGTNYSISPEYNPITIDDISISKSSQDKSNDYTGMTSVSESLAYYTNKPDPIKILFGDYFSSTEGSSQLSLLYAIYVGEAYQFSTGWYEYGTTNSPVAFGLALAKSILRARQKQYMTYTGDFKLKNGANEFDYLNTFSFDVPGERKFNDKTFCVLGCDIDLKYNTMSNVKLCEAFNRPSKSNDITVPTYEGSSPPIFTQDPNGTNNNGIFTEQFTEEFK